MIGFLILIFGLLFLLVIASLLVLLAMFIALTFIQFIIPHLLQIVEKFLREYPVHFKQFFGL